MASFSAVCVDLLSSVLIVRHSFKEADLWSKVSTNVLHLSRLCLFFAWLISSFICDRAGEVGSRDLRSSRALIMSTTCLLGGPRCGRVCAFQRGCDVMLLSRWRHVVSFLLTRSWVRLCAQCFFDVLAVSFSVRLFKVYIVPMKRRGRGGCHLQTNED